MTTQETTQNPTYNNNSQVHVYTKDEIYQIVLYCIDLFDTKNNYYILLDYFQNKGIMNIINNDINNFVVENISNSIHFYLHFNGQQNPTFLTNYLDELHDEIKNEIKNKLEKKQEEYIFHLYNSIEFNIAFSLYKRRKRLQMLEMIYKDLLSFSELELINLKIQTAKLHEEIFHYCNYNHRQFFDLELDEYTFISNKNKLNDDINNLTDIKNKLFDQYCTKEEKKLKNHKIKPPIDTL